MNVSPYWNASKSVVKSSGLSELIHGDLMGPMRSRYINVYLLKVKSDAIERFKEYTAFMESHLSCRIKILRTDNGSEFCNKKFKKVCSSHVILHQTSAPYSPQQICLVERANWSLVEPARLSLYYQHADESFWGDAIITAAYTLNLLPNASCGDQTPYEIFWGEKSRLDPMRVFGSPGFCICGQIQECEVYYQGSSFYLSSLN
ncbi:hypothetical protein PsorP6_001883 [Peronosclerospora sorghi]|uniref:Uncharacterized protein n=1 Tax=Peronosclerospora sorghi TaxID=230839 RepID=A0ACC0WV81_9STRA|nr:hypothetical protein PsorP6_001883 [Peronosclerospora sorghi]